jgi:putative photosynthetic complex assembly protein 2
MSTIGLPVLFAAFVWWFATGALLWLNGLPRKAHPWILTAATAGLAASVVGVVHSAGDPTPAGAYCAFACTIGVWAWNEIAFLMGYATGPRREACGVGVRGWERFCQASEAVLVHEVLIAVSGLIVAFATWSGPNRVAYWTFLILWTMRLSAKLNLFLGVRNFGEEFLPGRMRYLASYFARKPMNALFPISVTGGTIVTALLGMRAFSPDPTEATGAALMGSLLGLAVLEHWFMVLPISTTALWEWGMRRRESTA